MSDNFELLLRQRHATDRERKLVEEIIRCRAINAELLEAAQAVVDVIGGGSGAMERLRAATRLLVAIQAKESAS